MSQTKAQLIDPVDGTIVNADINASAAIAGSKISPDFGSQAVTTTGSITGNNINANSGLDISIASGTQSAIFPNSSQVNGITGMPSQAGTPFIVGKDTGTTRSAIFAGSVTGLGDIICDSDSSKFKAGLSADLELFHNGSHSFVKTNTGTLYLQGVSNLSLIANNKDVILGIVDAEVRLFHNNSKKFETTSTGVAVTGNITATGDATISGSDLTVTGTNPIIHLTDTNDNSDFQLNVNAGVFQVYDHTNSAGRLLINSSGQTTIQPILKISNTPSGTSSGAIRINTDLALYGHIQVRDQNQNQTAALNVENANDGTGETNYIYRSVDLASSTWANARMTALSHNFQVQNDTPGASDRLKIDTNGLRVTGASSGATQVSGVRVNTDFLNYGGVTVRDAHTEGASDGSNHIACFQAENPGSGNNEVNLVSRSVNLNSANWARARYAALEHEFSIGGSSASGDVKATVTSSGIKLASSCGINFSAYASSGNPSSNLLDDYEEGTFTLTVASGGFSSINGTGFYSKVGRIVVFQGDFSFVGTGNSDVLKLDGLPFAAASWTACSGYAQYYNNEGSQQASWAVRGNTNDISVVEYGNEAAGNVFQAGYFNVAGCYNV